MGSTERKTREKEQMMNLIKNTAFEMFLNKGYEGTSLRAIAKKIEYSPGTIYLYYKDKDALFFDIQRKCFENHIAQYQEAEKMEDPVERLRQIGIIYMDYNMRNPYCFNLMYLLDAPLNELYKTDRWGKYGNVGGFVKYTVTECVDKGLIGYSDPLEAVMELWGLLHGLTTLYVKKSYQVMGPTENQFKEYMETIWKNFMERITT